jgi:hypothetical protein
MPWSIDWREMAQVDLLGIGDPTVIAELIDLALKDLDTEFLPPTTVDQGVSRGQPPPGLAWRRGLTRDAAWDLHSVPAEVEDNSTYRACDYALIYRPPTASENLEASKGTGRKLDFVIIRVVPSQRFAQELTHEIAEQALQLGDPWTRILRSLSEG